MADLTYLMNADPPGTTNQFYTLAKQYFVAAGSTVVDAPAKGQTIEGIFNDLKTKNTAQGTINIVSHAVGFGGIEGPITLADQNNGRTMTIADDMQDALANKTLAPPGPAIITDKTRIVLYGCDVGRSLNFLKLMAVLFGNPGELLAPRRLSMFKQDGTTVKYRQAQSWTLVRKAHLTPAGANEPTVGWPVFRTQFVKDASDKFGRAAIQSETDGDHRFTTILTTAASSATKAIGPAFFLEETLDIFPTGTQTAKQAADSIKPVSNGDPVTATAQSAAQVDDTTVVTTVSGTDAYSAKPDKTQYSITLIILAQIIDQDVPIAEGTGYARVTSSKGLAPSPGPKATGGGTGSTSSGGSGSGADNYLQPIIDELLANGVPQEQVDELLAEAPQGDATEGLITDSPDAIPSPSDPDVLLTQADLA